MSLPNIVFRDSLDTKTLPQTGTNYFDWNATDGAGGTSDTPNPLGLNTTSNIQYVRLKNLATATNATASYIKFYISGTNADVLAGLGYLRLQQGTVTSVLNKTKYSVGIPLVLGSGTDGDVLSPLGITLTISLFVVTTATGVNANDWSLVAGFYYVP